jgi:hypothetical protein
MSFFLSQYVRTALMSTQFPVLGRLCVADMVSGYTAEMESLPIRIIGVVLAIGGAVVFIGGLGLHSWPGVAIPAAGAIAVIWGAWMAIDPKRFSPPR